MLLVDRDFCIDGQRQTWRLVGTAGRAQAAAAAEVAEMLWRLALRRPTAPSGYAG
jgi:hypothetical protein